MTKDPCANDCVHPLEVDMNATIQIGGMFIACTVKSVSGKSATLVEPDGTTYIVNKGRGGVYKYDKQYRVIPYRSTDNRSTWLD